MNQSIVRSIMGAALACAALVLGLPHTGDAQARDTYDLVIAGGRVIDPETRLDAVRNVGITGDRILAVSTEPLRGKRVIDAAGLVVAPGFIDLHAHGQTVDADRMQAFDGVTTSLELESGILPIGDWYARQATARRVLNYGASVAWTFARIYEMEGLKPEADLTWFQAAFALQKWVNQPATAEQIGRIVATVERGLDEGGLGIGINAGYAPGGGFNELLEVNRLAARRGVPTYTHVTCVDPVDPNSAARCVGELIAIAATTGARTHICHLNSVSGRSIETTAAMVEAARARGLPVTAETYTYGAGSTAVGAAGYSPEELARQGRSGADLEFNGEPLDDERLRKLRAADPGAVIVHHFLRLPDEQALLDRAVLMPGVVIASDAMPWLDRRTGKPVDPEAWPLPESAFAHPRSAGNYTRLLAQWVRERGVLDLPAAIEKSSLGPARILEDSVPQMRRKGRLQAGMDADVIVFDPARVQDRATFTAPAQHSIGMRYVLVNGVPVVDGGELRRDARPGRAIRR
jgi:N-acyl-D-glutamate deacylase